MATAAALPSNFHKLEYQHGNKYRVVYLNRLTGDRRRAAAAYLKKNRPKYYAWLQDPGVKEIIEAFDGDVDIPVRFKVKR